MRILYFASIDLDVHDAGHAHTLGVLRGLSNNLCTVDAILLRPGKIRPKIKDVQFFFIFPWDFSPRGKLWIKLFEFMYFLYLCSMKHYNAIYIREFELNPIPRWFSKLFNIPLYIEINGLLILQMENWVKKKSTIYRAERNQFADFKQSEGLIVPSYPRCRWIINHYNLEPSKVHFILNGTDVSSVQKTNRSNSLKKLNLPENGFYLGFLGKVQIWYDLETILDAIVLCRNSIPNLYLIIIGGGSILKKILKKPKAKRLISNIITIGYIKPEDLHKTIGAFDIGLMNLTKQGLEDIGPIPTRFATYAAFNIPMIGNNSYIEYYPEEIKHNSYTIPPEDSKALAEMITWLYHHPEERKRKAETLHDLVIKNMTWESVAKEILEIINDDIKG